MLKRIAVMLLVVLSLSLQGCVSATAALKSYVDSYDGYQFLYPTAWVPVKVEDGPDIVLHDMIEPSENVSVVINPVPEGKTLQDLGTPSEVGYRLSKNAIAPPDSGRTAELLSAESRQDGAVTYYMLEYAVHLPDQERRNLASVAIRRGQLYTLNVSTTERRWEKLGATLREVANSFEVY